MFDNDKSWASSAETSAIGEEGFQHLETIPKHSRMVNELCAGENHPQKGFFSRMDQQVKNKPREKLEVGQGTSNLTLPNPNLARKRVKTCEAELKPFSSSANTFPNFTTFPNLPTTPTPKNSYTLYTGYRQFENVENSPSSVEEGEVSKKGQSHLNRWKSRVGRKRYDIIQRDIQGYFKGMDRF